MIIDIAKRKFNTALNLAEHSRYFDALAIFTSYPDDYEAQLNRIGCLSAMGEPIAAVRVLRRLLAKCYFTHNVFADVMSLGEPTEHIVKDTVAKLIGKRNYARDDDKISADRNKLAHYEFVPDDNDGLGLELDFFNDSTLWDAPAYAEDNFYDIKSKVYRDHLRLTMEKSFLEGEDEKFQLYAKRLLALKDADDIETVEAQVVTAYYLNKRTKAVGFIEKLCKFDNVSSRALRVALSVMFDDKNLKCKKVITRLMELAMPVIAEFSPLDLCDMIMFAENVAQNDEYAYKFAKELFPVADTCYGAIDYLRVCACALYNGHDKETARNAVLRILAGYPEDSFAQCFLQFLNEDFDPDYSAKFDIAGFDCRPFWLPKPLIIYEEFVCFGNVDKELPHFDREKLVGIAGLIGHTKALATEGNEPEYIELTNLLRYSLAVGSVEKDEMIAFCKERLADVDNHVYMNESLLQRMVHCGCRDKVFVCGKKCFWLDLSVAGDDQLFAMALCSAAALMPVNAADLKQKYDELYTRVGGKWPDKINQLQVAYYLLCKTDKKFPKTPEATSFRAEDKQVFAEYLDD